MCSFMLPLETKWGKSLVLRGPKAFAQELGASIGKAANMEVRDGKLVVEVAKPKTAPTPRFGTTGCRHNARKPPPRARMGPPVGDEAW
jgi:antitoxin MazE